MIGYIRNKSNRVIKYIKRKRIINKAIRYLILVFIAAIMLYPLLWLFGATFKRNSEIFTTTWFIPENGFKDLTAWKTALETPGWGYGEGYGIMKAFLNTFRYVIPEVVFMTITCLITAYVIARMKFKGRKIVFATVITTLLMPSTVFRIPMYLFWQNIDFIWKDYMPFLPLWAGSLFAINSFSIFMYIQFFRTIPRELDEAAVIDGCNTLQVLYYVLVPILKPIVITVALLIFIAAYNDFQGPLIYVTDVENYTLSQVLRLYVSVGEKTSYAQVYARSFISLVPTIVIFFIAQKYFVGGITDSALKG